MSKTKQGQAPYGFRWQGGVLHRLESEAAVRRLAFEWFLEEKSLTALARRLNGEGHFTRRGTPWSDVQVRRILECPSARGHYETGAGETVPCDAIVPAGLWGKVSSRLGERKKSQKEEDGGATTGDLSQKIQCHCGQRMGFVPHGKKYVCPECKISVQQGELLEACSDSVLSHLAESPRLSLALLRPNLATELLEINRIEAELAVVEDEQRGAEKMLLEKIVTKQRFEILMKPLGAKRASLEPRLRQLRERLHHAHAEAASPDDLQKHWENTPHEKKLRLLSSLVHTITVSPEEIDISFLSLNPTPKDENSVQHFNPPTYQSGGHPSPESGAYLRLPKPGQLCPVSGLSRAKLNELILPNARNNYRPPVASKSLKSEGQQRGVRLIIKASLLAYLAASG